MARRRGLVAMAGAELSETRSARDRRVAGWRGFRSTRSCARCCSRWRLKTRLRQTKRSWRKLPACWSAGCKPALRWTTSRWMSPRESPWAMRAVRSIRSRCAYATLKSGCSSPAWITLRRGLAYALRAALQAPTEGGQLTTLNCGRCVAAGGGATLRPWMCWSAAREGAAVCRGTRQSGIKGERRQPGRRLTRSSAHHPNRTNSAAARISDFYGAMLLMVIAHCARQYG